MMYNNGVYVIVLREGRERESVCVSEIEDKTMMKRKKDSFMSVCTWIFLKMVNMIG